jgi:hypothetical protein
MKPSLFESFADMIETIPVHAILRTLERESRMLEEDLAYQRPIPPTEARSILDFCRFVAAVGNELQIPALTNPPPPPHLEFYRKTVARLVDAEELPFDAKMEFDSIFSSGCLKPFDYAV